MKYCLPPPPSNLSRENTSKQWPDDRREAKDRSETSLEERTLVQWNDMKDDDDATVHDSSTTQTSNCSTNDEDGRRLGNSTYE